MEGAAFSGRNRRDYRPALRTRWRIIGIAGYVTGSASIRCPSGDSRYLLVNVVAHRARQLSIESEMTHEPLTDKPVTIAINEVARGELTATLKEKYRK